MKNYLHLLPFLSITRSISKIIYILLAILIKVLYNAYKICYLIFDFYIINQVYTHTHTHDILLHHLQNIRSFLH